MRIGQWPVVQQARMNDLRKLTRNVSWLNGHLDRKIPGNVLDKVPFSGCEPWMTRKVLIAPQTSLSLLELPLISLWRSS